MAHSYVSLPLAARHLALVSVFSALAAAAALGGSKGIDKTYTGEHVQMCVQSVCRPQGCTCKLLSDPRLR